MIAIYTIIGTLATTLRDNNTLRDFCITNSGRGCLIQVDDIADNPLSDADAPFIILAKAEPGELGATATHNSMLIRVVCGMSLPAVRFVDSTARSATANGLRTLEAGSKVEELMRTAVAACKAVALGSGILLEGANPDIDVYTLAPLQVATCNIVATQTQDLSTF
jgi:hypothetical protein